MKDPDPNEIKRRFKRSVGKRKIPSSFRKPGDPTIRSRLTTLMPIIDEARADGLTYREIVEALFPDIKLSVSTLYRYCADYYRTAPTPTKSQSPDDDDSSTLMVDEDEPLSLAQKIRRKHLANNNHDEI